MLAGLYLTVRLDNRRSTLLLQHSGYWGEGGHPWWMADVAGHRGRPRMRCGTEPSSVFLCSSSSDNMASCYRVQGSGTQTVQNNARDRTMLEIHFTKFLVGDMLMIRTFHPPPRYHLACRLLLHRRTPRPNCEGASLLSTSLPSSASLMKRNNANSTNAWQRCLT